LQQRFAPHARQRVENSLIGEILRLYRSAATKELRMIRKIERVLDALLAPLARELERLRPSAVRGLFGPF
jgi:hypothetical protein